MSSLRRVTLEYESHTQTLEGDDAQRWMDALNAATGLLWVHGGEFPAFEWQSTYADAAPPSQQAADRPADGDGARGGE